MHMQTRLTICVLGMLSASATLAAPQGDLTGDGRIDQADVAVMRGAFFTGDARADLDRDGRVAFRDLAVLKSALQGYGPRAGAGGQVPRVYLLPETQTVAVGETFTIELWWDFTDDPALGGGTDFLWNAVNFGVDSIVFDDNPDFDPALTQCDDENCVSPGLIDSLATGNFNGLAGDGPLLITTVTFEVLPGALEGEQRIELAEDRNLSGPFVSAITFVPYENLVFEGATVDVVGGLQAPRIDVEPNQIVFADTTVGHTTFADLTVSNTGNLPLSISGVAGIETPFTVATDGCSGQVVAAGGTCELTLAFTPLDAGLVTDSLTIASNDPNQPVTDVPVQGEGTPFPIPDILAPRGLTFVEVRVGETVRRALVIANEGTGELTIGQVGGVVALEPPFSIGFDACSSNALAPGETCAILIDYAPGEFGRTASSFDVPSNDPDEPDVIIRVGGSSEPRVGMLTHGIDGVAGLCFNQFTQQHLPLPLAARELLLCEIGGLVVEEDDFVTLSVRGVSVSMDGRVAGRVIGMTVSRVHCKNGTTGQTAFVDPLGPAGEWNCARAITIAPGDEVSMTAYGVVR
jgi:hypothetical protein